MNFRAEVEALGIVADSLPERAARGEFTSEELRKIGRYLLGRVNLVKGQLRTDELVAFQKIVESSYGGHETPV